MWKVIIGIIVAAVLGVGGFIYYQSSQEKLATPPAETAVSAVPTEVPTPTLEPVDKSAFTIEVLNGSGIVGKAGEVKTLLEAAEFTVDSTGNADNYDYDQTVIQAGEDVSPGFLKALREALSKDYDVSTSFDEIAGSSDSDVVVIVGKNDASGESMVIETEDDETDETSPTPTEEVTVTPAL